MLRIYSALTLRRNSALQATLSSMQPKYLCSANKPSYKLYASKTNANLLLLFYQHGEHSLLHGLEHCD
jgi:hypothetical protein